MLAIAFLGLFSPPLAVPLEERPQLLVLDLETDTEIRPDVARTLTDLIVLEAARFEGLRVLSGKDIEQLTSLEADKAVAGCDEAASCLAEIAGALGARFVISGRVSKLGDLLLLQMSLFDAHAATAISRKAVRANSLAEFADVIGPAVEELVAPGLGASPSPPIQSKPATSQSDGQTHNGATSTKVGEAPDLPLMLYGGIGGILLGGAVALLSTAAASAGLALYLIQGSAPAAVRFYAGVAALPLTLVAVLGGGVLIAGSSLIVVHFVAGEE